MELQPGHPTTGFGLSRAALIDIVERTFLLVLLGLFLLRFAPTFSREPYNVLLAISETFTVFLVLIRKPGAMASTAYAWSVAVIGTCAPLFATPHGATLIPVWLGMSIMSAGLFFSFSAKLFLNRSFGIVAANRGVKRTGPYRMLRHPMYLGYFVSQIGFLLLSMSMWNLIVFAAGWLALILRIDTEESFLCQDEEYRNYAADVRYRLIPGIY